MSYALRIEDIHRFATPGFLTDSVVLSEILTFGTLLLELALAILVWNRTLRPWVLALGVSLHVSIAFSIMVGFFTMLMLTLYLAFIPAETSRRLILSALAAWRGRKAPRRKAPRRKVTRRRPDPPAVRQPAHSPKSDLAESSDVVRS